MVVPEQAVQVGAASSVRNVDVVDVHAQYATLVWRSLQRLGVAQSDLQDVFQEVFVVVPRRLASFDRSAPMAPWLFGICMRVAAGWRRRAWKRLEVPAGDLPDEQDLGAGPEDVAATRQTQHTLQCALGRMDIEKRAILVMFEIDDLSTHQISEILGVPIGTVHSRLHVAREQFRSAYARVIAAGGRGGVR
jgi:RNA polymerase sigma-70 factor, ECF subfamily